MDNTLAIVVMVLMLALFALGQPVAFAMFTMGIIGLLALLGGKGLISVQWILWQSPNNAVLIAVPLFVLMGEILLHTGLSARLYRSMAYWLGRVPGGLFHSNIGACAIFAAISGSSPATAAAIGAVAIPEMEKRNYDPNMMLGSLAAGGTLGILIPPSITLIVYGAMVGESIGQLFMAGFIPGIMLALLFMLYIFVRSLFNRKLAPPLESVSWRTRFGSLLMVAPILLLVAAVLGTIYLGVATPTEAAALGVVMALILGFASRTLSWKVIQGSMSETVQVTVSVMVIFIGASLISLIMSQVGIPIQIAQAVADSSLSPYVILVLIYAIFLVLGCFFDPMSVMVLTIPVLYPVLVELGFDLIWFGIILVILIEAGMITPPVGLNLYIIQSIAPKYRFEQIVSGVIPFFLMQLVAIAIITLVPAIATWLPSTMNGG